jgi:pimeloyl-ACP methyl ester carboxylesterase
MVGGDSGWRRWLTMAAVLIASLSCSWAAEAHGRLVTYPSFASKYVASRDVTVWLPDGYDARGRRLPVVYMQDGQNLYDGAQSFGGVSWDVANTVSRLIRERKIPPVIIVGIANTSARGREYLPRRIYDLLPAASQQWIRQGWHGAPESDKYLKFIVDELKPFVDARYRTRSDRSGAFVMGSSMGGLIALYAQMEYPQVFGGSASLSMHWLLGDPALPLPSSPSRFSGEVLRAFETYVSLSRLSPRDHRIYIDRGTATLDARYLPYTEPFAAFMQKAGWRQGTSFDNQVYSGADHSERSWAKRLAAPMTFLLAPRPDAAEADEAARLAQIRAAASPADYLIGKFDGADVVLLGEDHAVKQNLAFVAGIIPRLYAAGVTNLVMEFGAAEDQARLDRLLTAPAYDAQAAKQLMFHYNVMWSWRDYRAIYKAVWQFNHSLPAGKPPFRIVNMSYVYDWSGFTGLRTPATLKAVFKRGMVDRFRADRIAREILDKRQKALVLTGTLHAFTRYEAAQTQSDGDGFCQRTGNALGNRLYRAYGARVSNVMFHQSLPSPPGQTRAFEQPGGGEVERIMHLDGDRPVGFDLRDKPMGAIRDYSYYGLCDRDFTLADLFDGYIFLAPFDALVAATPDPAFLDESNIDRAIEQYPDPDWSSRPADLAGARARLDEMAKQINDRYAALARRF